jgi:hypothetical protein
LHYAGLPSFDFHQRRACAAALSRADVPLFSARERGRKRDANGIAVIGLKQQPELPAIRPPAPPGGRACAGP